MPGASPLASDTSSQTKPPISREPPQPLPSFQPLRPAPQRLPSRSATPAAESQDLLDQAARYLIRSGTIDVEEFLRQARERFFNALKEGAATPIASTSTATTTMNQDSTASGEELLTEPAAQNIFDEELEDTMMASQMPTISPAERDDSESGSTLSETQVQGTDDGTLDGGIGEDKKTKKKSRKRSKRVGS